MDENELENLYLVARAEEAKRNDRKYLDIIIDLANRGHAKSQKELGWIYMSGLYSMERNVDLALDWHLKAVQSEDPENYFSLGMLFGPEFDEPSKSFSSDEVKSRGFYAKALEGFLIRADKDDTQAVYRIGEMYSSGLGVEVDQKEARVWFDKYNELKGMKGS